jgi:hypothetical protein
MAAGTEHRPQADWHGRYIAPPGNNQRAWFAQEWSNRYDGQTEGDEEEKD